MPPPSRSVTHTHAQTAGLGVTPVWWVFGRSPSRSAGALGPERAFPGIPGPRSRVAERAPRTPLSLGSGRSGFFQPPTLLGVKLLQPREAHCCAEAALGLQPRSVHRAAPAAICSEWRLRLGRRHPEEGSLWRLGPSSLDPPTPETGAGVQGGLWRAVSGGRRNAAPTPVQPSEARLGLAGPQLIGSPARGEARPRRRALRRTAPPLRSARGGRSRRSCGPSRDHLAPHGLGRESQALAHPLTSTRRSPAPAARPCAPHPRPSSPRVVKQGSRGRHASDARAGSGGDGSRNSPAPGFLGPAGGQTGHVCAFVPTPGISLTKIKTKLLKILMRPSSCSNYSVAAKFQDWGPEGWGRIHPPTCWTELSHPGRRVREERVPAVMAMEMMQTSWTGSLQDL
ncbi:translation initiation factor IF-2-like [Phyllostomus hastatus]|uniref:translation initiation factor IF-2-like n=1 Tax=Phyllostomus hastatus TaxID=9423 RepID=UPI001E67EB4D|nr:translation initiation factor IF-2-like [Phyllostomus hastatus]